MPPSRMTCLVGRLCPSCSGRGAGVARGSTKEGQLWKGGERLSPICHGGESEAQGGTRDGLQAFGCSWRAHLLRPPPSPGGTSGHGGRQHAHPSIVNKDCRWCHPASYCQGLVGPWKGGQESGLRGLVLVAMLRLQRRCGGFKVTRQVAREPSRELGKALGGDRARTSVLEKNRAGIGGPGPQDGPRRRWCNRRGGRHTSVPGHQEESRDEDGEVPWGWASDRLERVEGQGLQCGVLLPPTLAKALLVWGSLSRLLSHQP